MASKIEWNAVEMIDELTRFRERLRGVELMCHSIEDVPEPIRVHVADLVQNANKIISAIAPARGQ